MKDKKIAARGNLRAAAGEARLRRHSGGRLLSILLCAILLFTGCGQEQELISVAEESVIYYIDSREEKLTTVGYEPLAQSTEALAAEFLVLLATEPEVPDSKRVIPEYVSVHSVYFGVDGQLCVNFDSSYYQLTGISEVLCRAAIVKTLCQIEGISYVEFLVNGMPLVLSGETPVGLMADADFITSTGGAASNRRSTYLTVYYTNKAGTALCEAVLQVEYEDSKTLEQLALEILIDGPIAELEDMYPTLSENTKVNSVTIADGICTVDFNEGFLEKRSGVQETVVLYSVVNTLAELSNVNKVQITVNGNSRKLYQNSPMEGALDRNLELVESGA